MYVHFHCIMLTHYLVNRVLVLFTYGLYYGFVGDRVSDNRACANICMYIFIYINSLAFLYLLVIGYFNFIPTENVCSQQKEARRPRKVYMYVHACIQIFFISVNSRVDLAICLSVSILKKIKKNTHTYN